MKILITGGNSSIALKLLKAFSQHEVILGDYGDVPAFSSPNYTLVSLGEKNEDTLAHTLLNCCLDNGVDMILPLHEFELMPVAKTKVLFNEFNIEVLLPEAEAIGKFVRPNKHDNWLILKAGEAIFATAPFNIDDQHLSGAFYLADDLEMNLITVR